MGYMVMKLSEYITHLQALVKQNPEVRNYSVVYSSDSEGNSYEEVYYHPTVGCFESGEFEIVSRADFYRANSVCIN